jgi:hypothetical protein
MYRRILRSPLPANRGEPKSGLEALSVAAGLRPTYFVYFPGVSCTDLSLEARKFDEIALPLGLQTVVTNPPSLWFPDKGTDAIETLQRTEGGESGAVWFFRESSVADAIKKATIGEVDAGMVLGYPECCVSWHQKVREIELVRWRSAKRTSIGGSNEALTAKSDPSEFTPKSASRHATLTLRSYPFVSHVACTPCLANRHSSTSKLNNSISNLVKTIDLAYYVWFTRDSLSRARELQQPPRREQEI